MTASNHDEMGQDWKRFYGAGAFHEAGQMAKTGGGANKVSLSITAIGNAPSVGTQRWYSGSLRRRAGANPVS